MQSSTYNFSPIGFIRSAFKEKFGVPRQSLMMSRSVGILKLNPDPKYRLAVADLENFSHLWVIFIFHFHFDDSWKPSITPPRVDGPKKVGVFASRSPYRPNPIGMSALKIDRIDLEAPGGIEIHLSGLDLLDGTPVLDIKPYLPYADRIDDANSGWVPTETRKYPVSFSEVSLEKIHTLTNKENPNLQEFLVQVLELDPRPTSLRRHYPIELPNTKRRMFGFRMMNFEIKFETHEGRIHVLDILPFKNWPKTLPKNGPREAPHLDQGSGN